MHSDFANTKSLNNETQVCLLTSESFNEVNYGRVNKIS